MATTVNALAYHLTWTTYGTWRMVETAVLLTQRQRQIVEDTIAAHCTIREWKLHAVNARTNHVHVVVSAQREPDDVMNQLKAWCSQKLSDAACLTVKVAAKAGRRRWFTEGGDKELVHDDVHLQNAIRYVLEGQ